MPTNQQRREAAKRKLQRQLDRREKQQRARRQRLIIIGVVAAVLVVSGADLADRRHRAVSQRPSGSGRHGHDCTDGSPTEPATPCTYPERRRP